MIYQFLYAHCQLQEQAEMLKSLKSKDENFVNGVQASGEDSGEDVGEGGG